MRGSPSGSARSPTTYLALRSGARHRDDRSVRRLVAESRRRMAETADVGSGGGMKTPLIAPNAEDDA